jgi:predicted dehydrogenase
MDTAASGTGDLRPIRVGVVGAGFGARVVAPVFRQIGCDVVDVVSARDSSAVRALCGSKVDLIAVHSPPFLHADHVRLALDAGHAILCDKPFGLSTDEAVALAAEAKSAGVIHLVNFEFRHQPARQKMRELIMAGEVGRPEHLHLSAFVSGSRMPLRRYGWLFDISLGGGWIGAYGSHAIDTMRWLMGEVTSAGARRWITIPTRPDAEGRPQRCDAEDAFSAWVEFESGATASIDTSFTAAVSLPPRITVSGSNGVIENTGDVRVTLQRVDGSRAQFDFDAPPGDPHQTAMTLWAYEVWRSVVEARQVAPSFDDGVACARVMEMFRSGGPATVVGAPDLP